MRAGLVILKREAGTRDWTREGPTRTFDDNGVESGEQRADACGERWVVQDPKHRDYSVLRAPWHPAPGRGVGVLAMHATLLFLRYDVAREEWERTGHPMLFEGASGEAQARAFGEAWKGEGSSERRDYTVLRQEAPFNWNRR